MKFTDAVAGTGTDSWGYATGGELADYGNFLDSVMNANLTVYKTLLTLP